MLKKLGLLMICLVFTFSLSACGKNSPEPAPSPATSASATEPAQSTAVDSNDLAQTIFKQNCVTCHGVDLAGGVGPNLQKVGARLTQEQITTTITNGRGVMPAFKDKLKPEEINALAVWLFSKK